MEIADELVKQMNIVMDGMEKMVPKLAKIEKKYFDELVKNGFTKGQALNMVMKLDTKLPGLGGKQ